MEYGGREAGRGKGGGCWVVVRIMGMNAKGGQGIGWA